MTINIHAEPGETWAFIYHNWTNYETVRKPQDVASFQRMHGAQKAHKVEHDFSAIYAKKVPDLAGSPGKFDVALFRDPAMREPCGRSPWYYSSKPTRRNRYVMHNCNRYPLIWID